MPPCLLYNIHWILMNALPFPRLPGLIQKFQWVTAQYLSAFTTRNPLVFVLPTHSDIWLKAVKQAFLSFFFSMLLWCPQAHCWSYNQQVACESAFVPIAIHWTAACKILSCHSHLMSPFLPPRNHIKGSLCRVLWEDSTCRTCLSPGRHSVTVRWLSGFPSHLWNTVTLVSDAVSSDLETHWTKNVYNLFFPLRFSFCIDFPFLAQDWSPAKYQFTYRFC